MPADRAGRALRARSRATCGPGAVLPVPGTHGVPGGCAGRARVLRGVGRADGAGEAGTAPPLPRGRLVGRAAQGRGRRDHRRAPGRPGAPHPGEDAPGLGWPHDDLGVRDDSSAHPQHQGDPRPVGRRRLGARAGGARAVPEPRGLPQAREGMSVSDRLRELGLRLPAVAPPVATYVPALRHGDLVWTSGQLPMVDGALAVTGKVGEAEGLVTPEEATALARVAALNALAAVAATVGNLDAVVRVVKVVGYVASDPSFTGQSGVVNGASDLLGEIFGEAGMHARSAVGVSALPLDAPVEIELVVALG